MIKKLDKKEKIFILENNYIGYLGYIFQSKPFVVPITYFFDKKNNAIICYSGQGHKINAMRKIKTVSLQVAEITTISHWKSVLVHGNFEQHYGSDAKAYLHVFSLGVKDVVLKREQKDLDFISQFSSNIHKDDTPVIFLIKVKEITGKKRRF